MQRSSSGSRVSEDFFETTSIASSDTDTDPQYHQLPTYDPLSYAAKKQKSQLKSAENAIHVIPLVLALCAIILWFFSNPGSRI